MLRHLSVLAIILLTVAFVYVKVTGAYFCSYDDFIEIHRAAFEDSADRSRIVTTPHFNSYRYRPLNRFVNFLTFRAGELDAKWFRIRNLAFHLVNVVLIYILSWRLFGSLAISATGAVLFGLHPVTNQTIIGAVHTNSMSHAAFFGGLLMFMRAIDTPHRNTWIVGSVLIAWLGVLAYDSNIVVFGLMFLWMALKWRTIRECRNHGRIFLPFIVILGMFFAIYFALRHLYVPQGIGRAASTVPSAVVILKNAIMYICSLLLPLDVVLANEWLNTPLPSEIQLNVSWRTVVLVSLAGVCVGIVLLQWVKAHTSDGDKISISFLLMGIALPLLPVILLQAHPSETYLYLPMGFYAILLSFGLTRLIGFGKGSGLWRFYLPATVVLVVLFSSATWIRNHRVYTCGETARQIVYGLPEELLKEGQWKVLFAKVPGERTTRRYGFYGFCGIDTVGDGQYANPAITAALQLVYRNEFLSGEIVEPQQIQGICRNSAQSKRICALVYSDGRLEISTDQL